VTEVGAGWAWSTHALVIQPAGDAER